MPEDNVEIVRRVIEANRLGPPDETIDVVLAHASPEIEFVSRLAAVEGAAYLGHDGMRRYFADMADAWQEWRNDPEEIAEIAPGVVLASIRALGAGHDSGAPVELRSAFVFFLSQGKIMRLSGFATREEALADAGPKK